MRGGPREACRVDPAKRRKQPAVSLPSDLMDEIKAAASRLGIPASRAHEQALREWLLKQPGRGSAARFVGDVAEAVGMTMGDPIADIVAKVKLVSAIAEGVGLAPQEPGEIRAFVGLNMTGLKFGVEGGEPSDGDVYTLTGHDLAAAFRDWFDLD